MVDYLSVLKTVSTVTATDAGTAINIKTGTPLTGITARFILQSAVSAATSGTVVTPQILESDDNTTYSVLAALPPITLTTAAQSGEYYLTFVSRKPYIKSNLLLSPVSGSPSIVYAADLTTGRG